MGQTIQSSAVQAGTALNRFVEGESSTGAHRGVEPAKKDFWDDFGAAPKGPSRDKQDFWDEFAGAGETRANATTGLGQKPKPSGIGTSAMKKSSAGGPATGKNDDKWEDW